MVWDKHKFLKDKFMGLVTIKFNTELLNSQEALDDWFTLSRRPGKSKEHVSGRIHMKIQYGDVKATPKSSRKQNEKEDSEEVTEPQNQLHISSNWNQKDIQLKKSAYVVIQEDKDSKEELNNSIQARSGPPNPGFNTVTGSIRVKKTELEHTSGSMGIARSDVRVQAANWFFEVTVLNCRGTIKVGWATQKFKRETDDYGFFITNQGRKSIKGKVVDFKNNDRWQRNDVITIAADLVERNIYVWRNGVKVGTLFDSPEISRMIILSPTIILQNAKVSVNFGEQPFKVEPEGFNPLLQNLDKKGGAKLEQLYQHYKKIGIEDEEPEDDDEDDWEEAIVGTGTIQFSQDIGVDIEKDPTLLVVAWKLNCTAVWSFSKVEWMNGWSIHGCATIEQMKQKTKEWNDNLIKDRKAFKAFYKFVFGYLKEDKTILSIEEALMVWDLLFAQYKIEWKLYKTWVKFLNQNGEFIRGDVWLLLLDFVEEYPENLDEYDPLGSWPTLIDEFVEWIQDGCPEKEDKKEDED